MRVFSSPEHKVPRVSYCDQSVSVIRRRPSCVVRKLVYLNIFSSETALWIFTKLYGNESGWSPTKVVKMFPVGCISRSQGQEIGFQNAIFKNHLV